MQYRRRPAGIAHDGSEVWRVEARYWCLWLPVFRGSRDDALRVHFLLTALTQGDA